MTLAPPFNPEQLGELARRLHESGDDALLNEYRECFTAAALAARRKLFEPLTAEELAAHRALAEGSELCLEVLSSAAVLLRPPQPS
jgi:hypothetical protein